MPLHVNLLCICNVFCNCEDAQQIRYITCPAVKAYLSTFTDGPAYVEFDWRLSFLNKHLRSENSMRGDREYLICALVFKCAIRCGHASPVHTTRVLIALNRGGVKHLPNDLTNSSHRKWAGRWEENTRHRMARHRAGPQRIPLAPWNTRRGRDVTRIAVGDSLRAKNELFQGPGM